MHSASALLRRFECRCTVSSSLTRTAGRNLARRAQTHRYDPRRSGLIMMRMIMMHNAHNIMCIILIRDCCAPCKSNTGQTDSEEPKQRLGLPAAQSKSRTRDSSPARIGDQVRPLGVGDSDLETRRSKSGAAGCRRRRTRTASHSGGVECSRAQHQPAPILSGPWP